MDKFLIDQDKANHFVYGAIFCSVISLFISPITALLLTAMLGIAKELWDISNEGTKELSDFIWTTFGGFISILGELYAVFRIL
jgi:hypothetical protein